MKKITVGNITTPEYLKVTDARGTSTLGIAKMSAEGADLIAEIILLPDCPKHGTPTKVRVVS